MSWGLTEYMSDNSLKNQKRWTNIFLQVITYILLFALILVYGHKLYYVLCNVGPDGIVFQFEVREGVCLEMAKLFAEGINPYNYVEGTSYPAYMYGWVLPFLLSVFYRIGLEHVSLIAELLMLIIEIIGCITFYKILSEIYRVKRVIALFGALCFTTVFWRYTIFAGLMPDSLGVTVIVALMYLTLKDERSGKYRIFMYAMIYVLLFYLKIYFAVLALGHAIYLKKYDGWKTAITFVAQGIVMGGVSIIFVRLLFPTFFTINMYLLTIFNSYSFENFFWQFVILGKYYLPLYITYLLMLYECIRRKNVISYEIIQSLVSFLFIIVLGQSDGATYTYFLQLWIPYLIIVFVRFWDSHFELLHKKRFGIPVAIASLYMCMFLLPEFSFYSPPNWSEELEVKRELYEFIDDYDDVNKIKISPYSLALYCVERNIAHDEYGHSNAYNEKLLKTVRENSNDGIIFPYAEQLIEEYLDYMRISNVLVSTGYYDVVVINESEKEKFSDSLVSGKYNMIAVYRYHCGVFPQNIIVYTK